MALGLLAATVCVVLTGALAAAPLSAAAASTCTATLTVSTWTGGYQGNLTVANSGPAVNPWQVTFGLPATTTLVSGWNADVSQTGVTVTAKAPSWNQSLGTGQQVSIGFTANGPAVPPPSNVQLNGVGCGGVGAPTPTPTTASPSPSATVSPSPTGSPTSTPSPTTAAPSGSRISDGFENQTGTTPSGSWTPVAPDCSGTGSARVGC
jgi:hypothetical protein